jgi:hypothetical protein
MAHRSFRSAARVAMLLIVCASFLWTLWLLAFGGFGVTLLGARIRSNNPQRVFEITLIALIGFFLAGGRIPVARIAAHLRAVAAGLGRYPGRVALLIAIGSAIAAYAGSTRIAGGPDVYGYVSQADQQRQGDEKALVERHGQVAGAHQHRARYDSVALTDEAIGDPSRPGPA